MTDDRDEAAEMAVLRVLTNGEPVTHEVLDALRAVGWGRLPTPPADDVGEALAAARNVERYIDMLALDADDLVHVVIDDGYDGDGVIQSLEVPDLRALIAFVREVRPRGTVTDAEPVAWAIYGRKTGALRHVVQDGDIAFEMSEHYDIVALHPRP